MVSHEDTGKRYVRGIVDGRSGRRVIREATHPRKPKTMGDARRIRVSLELAALGGSWRQFQIDAGAGSSVSSRRRANGASEVSAAGRPGLDCLNHSLGQGGLSP